MSGTDMKMMMRVISSNKSWRTNSLSAAGYGHTVASYQNQANFRGGNSYLSYIETESNVTKSHIYSCI